MSAPAGFGKTTLLAQWLAGDPPEGRAVAWLSLDHRDNDQAVFWAYLVAALQTAAPGVGVDALSILQSPQPPTEAVLATLVNELSVVSQDVLRSFIDEGAPMTALLTAAAKRGLGGTSARRLLAAAVVGVTPARPPTQQDPIEPLSRHELEVLRMLRSDLDGPGIARELSISLSTVRTHTKNIFAKLGVNARRAAVRRAQELGLLP